MMLPFLQKVIVRKGGETARLSRQKRPVRQVRTGRGGSFGSAGNVLSGRLPDGPAGRSPEGQQGKPHACRENLWAIPAHGKGDP